MKKYIKSFLLCILLSAVLFIGGCNPSEEPPTVTRITDNAQSTTTESGNNTAISNNTEVFTESETAVSPVTQPPADEPVVTTPALNPPADKALQLLSQMSVEEKIGQVILCRYPDNAAELQEKYHFGGYTLYAKDFQNETEESIKEKLAAISASSSIPTFIAADEEGGSVVRISKYPQFSSEPLPPLGEGARDIAHFAEKMAEVLKKGGVNLNLAPVADVAESEWDYIFDRTCGLSYEETGRVITALVKKLNGRNIMCCLKHFPGYGSNVDTHTGIAVDERTQNDFVTKDFIPFKKGIEAGAPMVMVNHNIVTAYNQTVPASLAPEVHKALRDLGFEGIIVTDDLGMSAITEYTDDPYTDAFLAGNDLLCTSDGIACYNALYQGIVNGEIDENKLDESVYRILMAKIGYGIIK